MPTKDQRPSAMKPGELQRHLVRLGLTIEHASFALGFSYEHVRALIAGRSRVTEVTAMSLRQMTLEDASNTRIEWWHRHGFTHRRAPSRPSTKGPTNDRT